MILTAHQPVYQPWLGLLHKIASADVFCSWDDVQMEDSGYENRNRCGTSNEWLTVPVKRSRTVKIKDLEIATDQPWQRKHWRAIQQAYDHTPFWGVHSQFLRWLYEDNKWERLVPLNEAILGYLLTQFHIAPARRVKLSELAIPELPPQHTLSKDLPRRPARPNAHILAACRAVEANKYLFGELGKDYWSPCMFREAGIEPYVQEYRPVSYPQQSRNGHAQSFMPRLWAFDLLFNVERERAYEFMMEGGTTRRLPESL